MNLILLISVPCLVILCGVHLAMDHAYEQMDITILSIEYCGENKCWGNKNIICEN